MWSTSDTVISAENPLGEAHKRPKPSKDLAEEEPAALVGLRAQAELQQRVWEPPLCHFLSPQTTVPKLILRTLAGLQEFILNVTRVVCL